MSSTATPLKSLHDALPDVQSEAPQHALALSSVGVVGLRMALPVSGGTTLGTIDALVNLPADQRGAHMSRFHKALATMPRELPLESFADALAQELLRRHAYATFASVKIAAPVLLDGMVVDAVASSQAGHDGAEPLPASSALRLTVHGSTVCPCSFAMSGDRYAHVQRASLTVTLSQPRVGLSELRQLVEPAFSAPVAMVLDRPAEKALVDQMFANPRFVEDVAREAAARLIGTKAGTHARVEAVAHESIHPYDCAATWQGAL